MAASAVVAYGAGYFKAVVFVFAMVAGMGIYEIGERRGPKPGMKG